ncbi:MAG: IS630 family transposase [Oscillospiraceae bacterium]|jgi:hypothetical protein|nr:IS630 family transposase [Oscillospiraceae bacterium]
MWCIPPEQNAEFVAKMEDVLDVYALPYDENCPVICLDEKPYQLLDERREPIPMKQGSPAKYDNEYERMGTCSIFVMTEPLKGWHYANASKRRTAVDWANEIKWLLTESPYKNAPKIKLVQDNLNTHVVSSLYKAFPAPEARKYAKRLEFHYTPKHGSWLNIAELTISVLSKQCINRRIANIDGLNNELFAWQAEYSNTENSVNWQFTTDDARIKLKRLYPAI